MKIKTLGDVLGDMKDDPQIDNEAVCMASFTLGFAGALECVRNGAGLGTLSDQVELFATKLAREAGLDVNN